MDQNSRLKFLEALLIAGTFIMSLSGSTSRGVIYIFIVFLTSVMVKFMMIRTNEFIRKEYYSNEQLDDWRIKAIVAFIVGASFSYVAIQAYLSLKGASVLISILVFSCLTGTITLTLAPDKVLKRVLEYDLPYF
ncbi:MAG: hypothetical protein MUP58_00050 [Candidatus Nanohaloarchaeota archaeon QJJ-9]|nr:hypothetical protein [Candidatus Nanohaloarchaeota archaeon QJJ-9]